MLTTGRAAMQKKLMALLRRIEHSTTGVVTAWEDTYRNWEGYMKALQSFPKVKVEELPQAEAFHNRMGKRRASHHR